MHYQLLWMHLLNAEIDLGAREGLDEHLRRVLGPDAASLDDTFFREQRRFLARLRDAFARQRRLGAASSELSPLVELAGGSLRGDPLDGLLAPGLGPVPTSRAHLWQQLLRAALLGFAAYLHGQAYAEQPLTVDRCSGLSPLRPSDDAKELVAGFPTLADDELVRQQLGAGARGRFLRCGQLFVRVGRGDFCSKACRDRSFALARRQRDPSYDADKQRRYRARLKQAQAGSAG